MRHCPCCGHLAAIGVELHHAPQLQSLQVIACTGCGLTLKGSLDTPPHNLETLWNLRVSDDLLKSCLPVVRTMKLVLLATAVDVSSEEALIEHILTELEAGK